MRKSDLTRKHFIALADALRESKPNRHSTDAIFQWQNDVDTIAVVCHKFSDLFNEEKWREYLDAPKSEAA